MKDLYIHARLNYENSIVIKTEPSSSCEKHSINYDKGFTNIEEVIIPQYNKFSSCIEQYHCYKCSE